MFLHKGLYIPPSFREEIGAFHCKAFSEASTFLTVGNLCNIQINTGFFSPFDSRKKLHSSSQKLLETFSFHYIFTNFQSR